MAEALRAFGFLPRLFITYANNGNAGMTSTKADVESTRPYFSMKLRLHQDEAIALGPGKVELLEALLQTGSISAAARRMKMSYRRAWLLVDTMNQCFKEPLVTTATGGKGGGGAHLTDFGQRVLLKYRAMETQAKQSIEADIQELMALLNAD